MDTKIGCNTLYPYGRLEGEAQFDVDAHRRALDIIAEAGLDAVEFSHAAPLSLEGLSAVAEHTRSLGLIPWSSHTWTPLAGEDAQVAPFIARLRAAADAARILGNRVVVIHSGGGMEPARLAERRRANLATLQALSDMVGPDTFVAVENGARRADWEFIVEMVAACPAPNVGLNIDTGHANLGDLGVVEAIHMAAGRIRTTHLQDNRGEHDDHLPPGDGQIDFPAALAAFREARYQGVYMIEITDVPPGRPVDPAGDTRRAAANLRRFLGL